MAEPLPLGNEKDVPNEYGISEHPCLSLIALRLGLYNRFYDYIKEKPYDKNFFSHLSCPRYVRV